MRSTKRRVGRPRDVSGDETRAKILKEARACFAAYGYAATNNRMIAERVGVSTAALHHHFGRKHELLAAVSEATEGPVYERMSVAVAEAETFVDKVKAVLWVTHEVLREDPDMAAFEAAIHPDLGRHEELAAIGQHALFAELFHQIARFGVESGAVAEEDEDAVHGVITALSRGVAFLSSEVRLDTHEAITNACMRLLDGNLFVTPPPAAP